jgi:hypothetical protein
MLDSVQNVFAAAAVVCLFRYYLDELIGILGTGTSSPV